MWDHWPSHLFMHMFVHVFRDSLFHGPHVACSYHVVHACLAEHTYHTSCTRCTLPIPGKSDFYIWSYFINHPIVGANMRPKVIFSKVNPLYLSPIHAAIPNLLPFFSPFGLQSVGGNKGVWTWLRKNLRKFTCVPSLWRRSLEGRASLPYEAAIVKVVLSSTYLALHISYGVDFFHFLYPLAPS